MKNLLFLTIGFVCGIILGMFLFELVSISIDDSKTHSVLETVYYVTAPIGVLFTVGAVVVAIWGNEIRSFLNKEKCDVEIVNGGFVEDVRGIEDDENMGARQYNCNLIVKNIGNKEIENCTIYITKIVYREDEKSREKNIGFTNKISLYWFDPNIKTKNILKGESIIIPAIRVYPDNNNQTPDQQNKRVTPRRLSIIGFNIETKYSKKGIWEISYVICNAHESLKEFKLIAKWDGTWHRREKEMNDYLSVHRI